MISFGAKIPIAKCKIQNKESGQFENATVYEYTCSDKSDVEKIKRITAKQDWQFGFDIYNDARWKNYILEKDLKKHSYRVNSTHFYTLENSRRKTIGLCETQENDALVVDLFETRAKRKYRFVGQTMLAVLARKVLDSSTNSFLVIQNALPRSLDFYKKVCGFGQEIKDGDEIYFVVDKSQLQQFVDQTEQRTTGKLISLYV